MTHLPGCRALSRPRVEFKDYPTNAVAQTFDPYACDCRGPRKTIAYPTPEENRIGQSGFRTYLPGQAVLSFEADRRHIVELKAEVKKLKTELTALKEKTPLSEEERSLFRVLLDELFANAGSTDAKLTTAALALAGKLKVNLDKAPLPCIDMGATGFTGGRPLTRVRFMDQVMNCVVTDCEITHEMMGGARINVRLQSVGPMEHDYEQQG